MTWRADLHCHTTCSDGSYTPEDIVDLAVQIGLQALCITDHDSIAAYETIISIAAAKGCQMVTGVEFSSTHKGSGVHVLGYAFADRAPSIVALCEGHRLRRERRNLAILELLGKRNMPLDNSFIYQKGRTVGRPHIAQAMVDKGYVASIHEAFKKFLGDGKECFVRDPGFSVQETIDVIHEANGFAIIAHPHLIKEKGVVTDLLKMNFDGIEAYYAKLNKYQELPWVKIAQEKGWLITGGSDFHGSVKPEIPLGCSWVDEATFAVLRGRYCKNCINKSP